MPRRRTIDPDLWTARKMMQLSLGARMIHIGTISMADDDGRLGWSAIELRAKLLPGLDDISVRNVEGWMAENVAVGLLMTYRVDGEEYAWHPKWTETRHVSRPSASKRPPPPHGALTDGHAGLTELHGALTDGHAGLTEGRVPSVTVTVTETETETGFPLNPPRGAREGR